MTSRAQPRLFSRRMICPLSFNTQAGKPTQSLETVDRNSLMVVDRVRSVLSIRSPTRHTMPRGTAFCAEPIKQLAGSGTIRPYQNLSWHNPASIHVRANVDFLVPRGELEVGSDPFGQRRTPAIFLHIDASQNWLGQICVHIAGVRIECEADDRAVRCDGAGSDQVQRSGAGNQAVKVDEFAVLADKRANDTEICARREANDLPFVVNAKPNAVRVIVERVIHCAQILHLRAIRPREGMRGLITGEIGAADYLAQIVDAVGKVIELSSQVAEIGPRSRLTTIGRPASWAKKSMRMNWQRENIRATGVSITN